MLRSEYSAHTALTQRADARTNSPSIRVTHFEKGRYSSRRSNRVMKKALIIASAAVAAPLVVVGAGHSFITTIRLILWWVT